MNSTVGAAPAPAVIRVFSTGARTGGGVAIIRPGRRARDWAARRRCKASHSDPPKIVPAPTRPASSQPGLTLAWSSPPVVASWPAAVADADAVDSGVDVDGAGAS